MLAAAVGLLALPVPGAARNAIAPEHGPAATACQAAGHIAPTGVVTAIDDGRGRHLVWLTDADTNLWLCSADADGHVYAYDLIFEDLLRGAGVKLLPPVTVDRAGNAVLPPDPLVIAQSACQAYLGDPGVVVGGGADGLSGEWLPGYFVYLETAAGETFLCNATRNAQVWAFAEIGAPLTGLAPVG